MVEEQVEEELLITDEQRPLAPVERKAAAELQQELLDVVDQRLLKFPLAGAFGELEEVEDVRILDGLECLFALIRLERDCEVRQRRALALLRSRWICPFWGASITSGARPARSVL